MLRFDAMNSYRQAIIAVLAAQLFCGIATAQLGWNFVPKQSEYAAWPEHCRVQFAYISPGYENRYSQAEIAFWRTRIGEKTFIAMHHYCAALIYINRSRYEENPRERQYLVDLALNDGDYTYTRAEKTSILYPNIAVVMAQARYENNEIAKAVQILQAAIAAQPTRTEAYAELTAIYHRQDRLPQALEVLEQADAASGGRSAEVKYNLGLLQIEAGQIDQAVESARAAYALGHPLPGLRNKLQRLGRSVTPTSDADASRTQ